MIDVHGFVSVRPGITAVFLGISEGLFRCQKALTSLSNSGWCSSTLSSLTKAEVAWSCRRDGGDHPPAGIAAAWAQVH